MTAGWEEMLEHRMIPVVFRSEHLTALEEAARARGTRARAHLKVDTGMGRLGVLPADLPALLEAAGGCPRVELEGLCSHFANADLADAALTALQIARFRNALGQMRAAGFQPALAAPVEQRRPARAARGPRRPGDEPRPARGSGSTGSCRRPGSGRPGRSSPC